MTTQTLSIFEHYATERDIRISDEEFDYLLMLFPSLMVCMSDGTLDKEEWMAIQNTISVLVAEYHGKLGDDRSALLTAFLEEEARHLLENIDKWSEHFLGQLKVKLAEDPSHKEFVLESMYLFANIAKGICEDEQRMIDTLSAELSLTTY